MNTRQIRPSWISDVVVAALWVVPTAILISFLSSEQPGGARNVLRRPADCESPVPPVGSIVFAAEDYYDV